MQIARRGGLLIEYVYTYMVASYSGPTQLSVACSTEKWGEPGIFSHVTMTQSENGENLPNRLHFTYFQLTTRSTLGV